MPVGGPLLYQRRRQKCSVGWGRTLMWGNILQVSYSDDVFPTGGGGIYRQYMCTAMPSLYLGRLTGMVVSMQRPHSSYTSDQLVYETCTALTQLTQLQLLQVSTI